MMLGRCGPVYKPTITDLLGKAVQEAMGLCKVFHTDVGPVTGEFWFSMACWQLNKLINVKFIS